MNFWKEKNLAQSGEAGSYRRHAAHIRCARGDWNPACSASSCPTWAVLLTPEPPKSGSDCSGWQASQYISVLCSSVPGIVCNSSCCKRDSCGTAEELNMVFYIVIFNFIFKKQSALKHLLVADTHPVILISATIKNTVSKTKHST